MIEGPLTTNIDQFRKELDHIARWKDCSTCELCKTRTSVVLYRGDVPTDILFVGEGPGQSEDALGIPFVDTAPAGELLEELVDDVLDELGCNPRIAYTNTVACLPPVVSPEGAIEGVRPPKANEMRACFDRLDEFISIADPKVIVAVGATAYNWLLKNLDLKYTNPLPSIEHPGSITRKTDALYEASRNRAFLALLKVFENV